MSFNNSFRSRLFLALIALAPASHTRAVESCSALVVDFARRNPSAVSAESLAADYNIHGGPSGIKLTPELDGQRLILADGWRDEQLSGATRPWYAYTQGTFAAWLDGARYVRRNFKDFSFSPRTLQHIHSLVSRGMYYRGYERRRIEQAFLLGKMPENTYRELLKDIDDRKEIYYSQTDHTSLGGRFREDPLDNDITGGGILRTDGRNLSPKELDNLRSLSSITITNIVSMDDGLLQIRIRYPKVSEIETLVSEALQKAQRTVESRASLDDKLVAIVQMETELIAIHPFLNGNGRAIRLYADGLLMRLGLPPPIHLTDNDFVLSLADRTAYVKSGMLLYLSQLP